MKLIQIILMLIAMLSFTANAGIIKDYEFKNTDLRMELDITSSKGMDNSNVINWGGGFFNYVDHSLSTKIEMESEHSILNYWYFKEAPEGEKGQVHYSNAVRWDDTYFYNKREQYLAFFVELNNGEILFSNDWNAPAVDIPSGGGRRSINFWTGDGIRTNIWANNIKVAIIDSFADINAESFFALKYNLPPLMIT